MSTITVNDDTGDYRAILIDPGYLAPRGVETRIRASEKTIVKRTDRITGEDIPVQSGDLSVAIEPGAFRVIDFRLQ